MIRCPKCGSETGVLETREQPAYARRRRICKSTGCGTKVTTIEVVIHNPKRNQNSDVVMVRRAQLESLVELANRMISHASQEDETCPE